MSGGPAQRKACSVSAAAHGFPDDVRSGLRESRESSRPLQGAIPLESLPCPWSMTFMTVSLLWRERQIHEGGARASPPHIPLPSLPPSLFLHTTRGREKASQLMSQLEAWSWLKLGCELMALPQQPPAVRGSHLGQRVFTFKTDRLGKASTSPALDHVRYNI